MAALFPEECDIRLNNSSNSVFIFLEIAVYMNYN